MPRYVDMFGVLRDEMPRSLSLFVHEVNVDRLRNHLAQRRVKQLKNTESLNIRPLHENFDNGSILIPLKI